MEQFLHWDGLLLRNKTGCTRVNGVMTICGRELRGPHPFTFFPRAIYSSRHGVMIAHRDDVLEGKSGAVKGNEVHQFGGLHVFPHRLFSCAIESIEREYETVPQPLQAPLKQLSHMNNGND